MRRSRWRGRALEAIPRRMSRSHDWMTLTLSELAVRGRRLGGVVVAPRPAARTADRPAPDLPPAARGGAGARCRRRRARRALHRSGGAARRHLVGAAVDRRAGRAARRAATAPARSAGGPRGRGQRAGPDRGLHRRRRADRADLGGGGDGGGRFRPAGPGPAREARTSGRRSRAHGCTSSACEPPPPRAELSSRHGVSSVPPSSRGHVVATTPNRGPRRPMPGARSIARIRSRSCAGARPRRLSRPETETARRWPRAMRSRPRTGSARAGSRPR